MPHDFGRPHDVAGMEDDEIRELVEETLREYPEIDADWIEVSVEGGSVALSGRLPTGEAVQVAETAVREILGIDDVTSHLMVDELHREEAPADPEEAAARDEEVESQLGEGDPDHAESAAHLDEGAEAEAEAGGTHDVGKAVEGGVPWVPPDRPVSDGYESREDH